MRSATHTFASDPAEIGRARRAVTASLRSWGASPEPGLLLVVSELMTNAVSHGRGHVHVTVSLDDKRVRIEVHDQGAGLPAFRDPEVAGTGVGGFGLHLVDALSDDWGIDKDGGTRVWAETRRDPDAGFVDPPGAAMAAGAGFGPAGTATFLRHTPASRPDGAPTLGEADGDAGSFRRFVRLDGAGDPHQIGRAHV